jgi:hypothetical protein
MKGWLQGLFYDKLIRQTSIVSLILLVISLASILLFFTHLQPFIPLFNQSTWGVLRLADKSLLFLPVGIALIFSIVNLIIAKYIASTMPLVSRILAITSALCSLLVFSFLIRTFQLIY